MFNDRDLDMWIENDLNVLFEGKHGVGKTAVVIEAFDRHNLKWKYFSAATMDPWVDFVGVPKDSVDEEGRQVLDLIRPRGFHDDSVEAIFMDELNRAPKKVRNAVMELIQFKSINGVKFPNLKFIWAAINPDDDDEDTKYDVEKLDPAQKDRFHITVEVPYKPSIEYFRKTYGAAGEGAVEWWESLSDDQKEHVSPRRLEYAIQINQMGGNLRHALTHGNLNVTKLLAMIEAGSIKKKLRQLLKATAEERNQAFSNVNFVTNAMPLILPSEKYIAAFAEYIPKDMLSDQIAKGTTASRRIVDNAPHEITDPIMKSMIESGALKGKKLKSLGQRLGDDFNKHLPNYIPKNRPEAGSYNEVLIGYFKQINLPHVNGTHQRMEALKDINDTIESQLVISDISSSIAVMMFLSAVIARTQQATLNDQNHTVTVTAQSIMQILTSKAKAINLWPNDIWKATKEELQKRGPQKKYVSGKGAAKVFEERELDKIENFLFNSYIGIMPAMPLAKKPKAKKPRKKSYSHGSPVKKRWDIAIDEDDDY